MHDQAKSIASLMRPDSIAVIGASDSPARIGGRPIRYLLDAGYAGRILPINPNYREIQGLTCHPTVSDLPQAPDLAIIALPAAAAVSAFRESAERGVRGAIIFSADFAESGDEGQQRQAQLTTIARRHGVALLGPNCLGAFNAAHRFYGSFSAIFEDRFAPAGNVGIVSQSGGYGSHLCKIAIRRGVRVGHWMTTGNEAGLDVGDCIEWMASQPEIGIIVAYAEGVRARDSLVAGLRAAAAADKPVIFLKAGSSAVGSEAVRTHTAAMSGSDRVFDGMLVQFGATRAASTEAAVDAAYLLQRMNGRPRGNRLALVTISGAVGVQMADAAAAHGLEVPPLPPEAQMALKEINSFAAVRNPVDVTAQAFNHLELVRNNLDVVLRDGAFDALVAFFTVTAGSKVIAPRLSSILSPLPERYPDVPMLLCIVADPERIAEYEDAGFVVFEDHHRAIAALATAMRQRSVSRCDAVLSPDQLAGFAAQLKLHDGTEDSAKRVLESIGIAAPKRAVAVSPEAAVQAARAIGLPVAVKVHSPDILHKTEVGGVVLGLDNDAAVETAARDILERLRTGAVLIEAMAPPGVELIVGCRSDPALGPMIMIGIGGVTAELYKDVVFRLAPIGEDEARLALDTLRGVPLFFGFRGAPVAEIDAAATAVARLSAAFASDRDAMVELEINPLRVLAVGKGVIACDATLRVKGKATSASAPGQAPS
ncbi:acetate--CoA ligase family protein [Mesorhizobium sp. 1B3]|uniref:acetate--CoA ligase family protein n=1 Tax=Mesorhizobium sp. 1B3 TaxID=3243599 RepID=UPI003D95FA15